MPIDPLLAQAAFDPETTATLAAAFDAAWETLQRSGSTRATGPEAASNREQLAKYIIAAAQNGERDPLRLIERALADLAPNPTTRRSSSADDSSP